MLSQYPWFKTDHSYMEIIEVTHTHRPTEYFYRWVSMPGRFVNFDYRLAVAQPRTPDALPPPNPEVGARFVVLRIPWRMLRASWDGVGYWAIRDDAWWVPMLIAFDRVYYAVALAERRLYRWFVARGLVTHNPNVYSEEWLNLRGLGRIGKWRVARRETALTAYIAAFNARRRAAR